MVRPKMAVRHIPKPYIFFSLVLALALAGGALLAFRGNSHAQVAAPQALTAPGNPAISYADSHWNWWTYDSQIDPNTGNPVPAGGGQPYFQCAEFVARALSAEGLVPGLNPTSPQDSFGNYTFNGTTYDLNLITPMSGFHTLYDYLHDSGLGIDIGHNLSEAVPGDIVVFSDGNNVAQHTVILTQVDSTSTSNSLVDAHNSARYHYPLADEISGFSYYFIVHIQAGGTRGASQTVSQPNGTVDVFYKGTNGALYHAWYNPGSSWTTAAPMAGTATLGSEPSAVTSSPGVVDVFWKGADNNLWHVFYTPGSGWTSAAQSLGDGPLGGSPKAVAQSDGSIRVFWRGQDNGLWYASYTPGAGWQGPYELTSTSNLASDPAPVASKFGTWDVFWKGTDGNLWHVFQNAGSGWSSPQSLGDGILGGAPQAIGQSDGSIQVVWRGNDDNLWHAWYTPSAGWQGPTSITSGGNVVSDPTPVNSKFGTWDIFWTDAWCDACGAPNLWHVFQNGNSGWTEEELGDGPVNSPLVATGQPNGTVDVFWVGADAGIWHAWYPVGGPWYGPQGLGGSVV